MGSKMNANDGAGESQTNAAYANHHKFEKYNFTTPSSCDFCNGLLWGPRTGLKCNECGYNCHEKCKDNAPKACGKKFAGVPQERGVSGQDIRPVPRKSEPYDSNYSKQPSKKTLPFEEAAPWGQGRNANDKSSENSQIEYQGYLYKQVMYPNY